MNVSKMKLRTACLATLVTLLSACSMIGLRATPVTFPTSGDVSNNVRQLYQSAGVAVPAKGATATEPTTIDPAVFAQSGYRIVFTQCNQYFDAIVKTDNGLKMVKSDVAAAATAAAVIATLAEATPKAIGIIAATFGLGVVVIDNLDQYSFATPYPTQTRGLILKALAAYRQSNPPETTKTLSDGADLVAGYANICTYSGIAELAAESIAKATPGDITQSGPLFTDAQKSELQPINTILGLPPATQLTDGDYITLAVFADSATDGNTGLLDALVSNFSASVPKATIDSKIYDTTSTPHKKQAATLKSIQLLFAPLLSTDPQFAAQVATKEKTGATGPTGRKVTVMGIL